LSILAAVGNTSLAKNLLDSIHDDTKRQKFLRHIDPSTHHSIHIAAANGHTEFVQLLLDYGVDVNQQARHQYTPIMYAVRGEHIDIVRLLIKAGADLFMSSKRGKTPLYMAVKYGSLELVRVLIEEGGVDQKHIDLAVNSWQHSSMLFVASHSGRIEIIDLLLEKGADSNRKDDTGSTALHEAARNGHIKVLELLLTKGKARVDEEDENGDTALLLATHQKNLEVMRLLVNNGASMSHQNKAGTSMWDAIMEAERDFINKVLQLYREAKKLKTKAIKFTANPNPLLIATRGNHCDTLELLCALGVDPNSTDQDGNTFYHVAASMGLLEPIESKELQRHIRLGTTNKYGQTALHLAARNQEAAVVAFLVRKSKKENRNK